MKTLNILLFAFALLLTSCAGNSAYINKAGAYVTDIMLYDSEDPANTYSSFNYKNVFLKSETQRVSWEICLSMLNDSQKVDFPLSALYHKADSTLFLHNDYTQSIEAKWATSSHTGGWGWDTKGNWEPGKYFIQFYSEDDYLGRRDFEIVDDMNLQYIPAIDSYLESIKFFESGKNLLEFGNRIYRTKFKSSQTRYVNWELNLQHMFRNRNEFKVQFIFYDKNNEVLGEKTIDSFYEADWHRSNHNSGWGYEEFGRWSQGKYRVELYIDDELIATAPFEIIP